MRLVFSVCCDIGCLREKSMVWHNIDILRMVPHNNVIFSDIILIQFYLVVREVSTQMSNVTKVKKVEGTMGQNGLR